MSPHNGVFIMEKCIIFAWSDDEKMNIEVNADDLVICADSGIYFAEKCGVRPDIIVGDFDSSDYNKADELTKNGIEIIKLPEIKDVTDTYFAVEEGFRRGYKSFAVYGGIGGRFDHTLANLSVLRFIYKKGGTGTICGSGTSVYFIDDGECLMLPYDKSCGYISVFPADGISYGVYERGMKYSLTDATLSNDYPVGVSNEFTVGNDAVISVKKGPLYVIKILKENKKQ
jgi:thiamine pyrophosphokinase